MATIYTVGHGARSSAALISILQESKIELLVDVRAYPISRRHPQFSREQLKPTLAAAGIAYEWWGQALGGYRKVSYVEHMRTEQFRSAAAALAARAARSCMMCAESDPANCHRGHIADWLVRRKQHVVHLLAPGRTREHALDPQEDLWQDD